MQNISIPKYLISGQILAPTRGISVAADLHNWELHTNLSCGKVGQAASSEPSLLFNTQPFSWYPRARARNKHWDDVSNGAASPEPCSPGTREARWLLGRWLYLGFYAWNHWAVPCNIRKTIQSADVWAVEFICYIVPTQFFKTSLKPVKKIPEHK